MAPPGMKPIPWSLIISATLGIVAGLAFVYLHQARQGALLPIERYLPFGVAMGISAVLQKRDIIPRVPFAAAVARVLVCGCAYMTIGFLLLR